MRRPVIFVAALASACATLADGGGGDDNLPNAAAGPFRPLVDPELGGVRIEPFALDIDDLGPRSPSVIDADGSPDTLDVIAFFGGAEPPLDGEPPGPNAEATAIYRTTAPDGRTLSRSVTKVLDADLTWEGGRVRSPSAVRRSDGTIELYYSSDGGIGRALSSDGGQTFDKDPNPVLEVASNGWDALSIPRSPGVVADGESRLLFYEIRSSLGARIGEARSSDKGASFSRAGSEPVLRPAEDELGVGSPSPSFAVSSTGRRSLRLYVTVERATEEGLPAGEIGLAARFGANDPFERAVGPVFGAGEEQPTAEPSVVDFGDFAILFVSQRTDDGDPFAIAVGVAPGDTVLGPGIE